MTVIAWRIANLDRIAADGYVFTAHWAAQAEDGPLSANSYGSVHLDRPEGALIPFADLTEEIVVSWVKDRIDASAVEDALMSRISEQQAPTEASGLPWS